MNFLIVMIMILAIWIASYLSSFGISWVKGGAVFSTTIIIGACIAWLVARNTK